MIFRNVFLTVMACSVGTASCGSEKSDTPNSGVGHSNADRAQNSGDVLDDARPRVVALEPRRGASSIAPDARISVTVSCPHGGTCSDDAAATASLLAQKMSFTDGITIIAVVPQNGPSVPESAGKDDPVEVLPSSEYAQTFLPASPLRADTKYVLSLTSDSSAVMGFIDSNVAESTAALAAVAPLATSIDIFTGSVPLLAATEIANVPAKGLTSMRIRMSEPILLSSAINNIQLFGSNRQLIPTCVWLAAGARCADDTSVQASDVVDLFFMSAVNLSDLKGARLQLSGALKGTGDTLADGLAKVGRTLDSTGTLGVALDESMWDVCSSTGDVLCIRDLAQF